MAKTIIIGGGISGLTTANYLERAKADYVLIEASDRLGGKVETELVDGFLLDKGFQVFLTAYPEVDQLINTSTLQLNYFEPGAVLRLNGKFVAVSDPLRQPSKLFSSLTAPIGSFADKLKILQLTNTLKKSTVEQIFKIPETSTMEELQQLGFSNKIIERFFKPFLGGIFLERQLETSNRFFRFVMKMFAEGNAALPSGGIGKIAAQLASNIPTEKIVLNKKATSIKKGQVYFEEGINIEADNIVVACDFPMTENSTKKRAYNQVCNLYFVAAKASVKGKKLLLNGDGSGLVNNVVFVSQIDNSVAPDGKTLVSVTVIGNPNINDDALVAAVKEELNSWFGIATKAWRHLKTYRITKALPLSKNINEIIAPLEVVENVWQVGDNMAYGSLNAAMESGRKVAEIILKNK